jgi:thymidine kinase
MAARGVKNAAEVLKHAHEAQVIGIDEGQFLGPGLVEVCQKLARMGKRVIVAGLDQDYLGQPFEPMPQLLAIAEYITKTLAICVVCGAPANRTYRKVQKAARGPPRAAIHGP